MIEWQLKAKILTQRDAVQDADNQTGFVQMLLKSIRNDRRKTNGTSTATSIHDIVRSELNSIRSMIRLKFCVIEHTLNSTPHAGLDQ